MNEQTASVNTYYKVLDNPSQLIRKRKRFDTRELQNVGINVTVDDDGRSGTQILLKQLL
jgi:hypothetical protein